MMLRHAIHSVRHARLVVLLCLAALAVGCGASARTTALRTSLVSLNVARDTVRAASKAREKQIVDACNPPTCTKEQGHAELDAWRATIDKVTVTIDGGYDAIRDAAILDDAKSTSAMVAAVAKAMALVKSMKNPAPAPKTDDKGSTP